MDNQNKFLEQFREAARQSEQQRFPGFEEVWQQVEERLDSRDRKKAPPVISFKWMAAAAAVLILIVAGIFLLKKDSPAPEIVKQKQPEQKVPVPIAPQQEVAQLGKPRLQQDNTLNLPEIPEQLPAKVEATPNVVTQSDTTSSATTVVAIATPSSTLVPTSASKDVVTGRVIDANGQPLPGSSVVIKGTRQGVVTDTAGYFSIKANAGDQLSVAMVGYDSQDMAVAVGKELNIVLNPATSTLNEVVVVGYGATRKRNMTASAKQVQKREMRSSGSIAAAPLQGKAAGVYVNAETPGAGDDIRIRGINSVKQGNEPMFVVNGIPTTRTEFSKIQPGEIERVDVLKDAQASAIYGSKASNGVVIVSTKDKTKKEEKQLEKFNEQLQQSGIRLSETIDPGKAENWFNEEYNPFEENPFTSPTVSPLSTFSIDVDNASYTNIRRYINSGQKVPADAVRIEEMLNFFKYQYAAPKDNMPFAVHTEYSDAPWNPNHRLLRVALRAKDIPAESLPASNIVFLVDVSGSMSDENKLPLLKSSMKVLVDQLRPQDKVAIVVYAGSAGLVLPSTSGTEKSKIMDALNKLNAGGSTAGGEGIELAYKTAEEHFINDGNNRVVLATDGDFNVGINSTSDLQHLIEEKRESGIFLTCLGFGMGNYKDNRLETLADKGNGNYAYIDNQQEANRFLGKEFKGAMYTVAKDVKLQIEFNPAVVSSYRLLGYENRKLNDEDFVNDKVDAGEMGAGHAVTALYEIIPVGVESKFSAPVPALKYNKSTTKAAGTTAELATIKTRFKMPAGTKSAENSFVVNNNPHSIKTSTADFRFAAAVAWFGLRLRNSKLITLVDKKQMIELARGTLGFDPDGYRAEFIRLVEAGL
jgi:Ca-activated chloride channel homolog